MPWHFFFHRHLNSICVLINHCHFFDVLYPLFLMSRTFILANVHDFLKTSTIDSFIDKEELDSLKKEKISATLKDILSLSTQGPWILDRSKFTWVLGIITIVGKLNETQLIKSIVPISKVCNHMLKCAKYYQGKHNDQENREYSIIIQRHLWSMSQLIIESLKTLGILKRPGQENSNSQNDISIFQNSIKEAIEGILDQTTQFSQNDLPQIIGFSNATVLELAPYLLEGEGYAYSLSHYFGKLSSYEIEHEMIPLMYSIINIMQYKDSWMANLHKILIFMTEYTRGCQFFGGLVFHKIEQCLQAKDSKGALTYLKALNDADHKIRGIRQKYLIHRFGHLWTLLRQCDYLMVKTILGYVLTTMKSMDLTQINIGPNVTGILFKLTTMKDAHIRSKSLDVLASLFPEGDNNLQGNILRHSVSALRDISKKVKISALKAVLKITEVCLNHEMIQWYKEKLLEYDLPPWIIRIMSTPSFSPEYNKDIFDVSKGIVVLYIREDLVDLIPLLKQLSSRLEDKNTQDLIVEAISVKLNHLNHQDTLLWWCHFVDSMPLSELIIYEPIISSIDHDSLSVRYYLDETFEIGRQLNILKLCVLIYSKNMMMISNYFYKFIDLLRDHLSDDNEIPEIAMYILSKIDYTQNLDASNQMQQLLHEQNILKMLLSRDSTRRNTMKTVFHAVKRPRALLFQTLENILSQVSTDSDIVFFLNLLKDVVIENGHYIGYLTHVHVSHNEEDKKVNVKDTIERIVDHDLTQNYLGRFIDMVAYGSFSENIPETVRMASLVCLGVYLVHSPSIAKEYFPAVAKCLNSSKSEDINKPYILMAAIGADMIRILPNEAHFVVQLLFNSLILPELGISEVEEFQRISLLVIDQLQSERIIKVDDKIYKVASLLSHSRLGAISSRIIQKYLNHANKNVSAKFAYQLCMSILSDSTWAVEKSKDSIKSIVHKHLKPEIQRELSLLLLRGILSRLKNGRIDPLIDTKSYLYSQLHTSKIASNLTSQVLTLLDDHQHLLDASLMHEIRKHLRKAI